MTKIKIYTEADVAEYPSITKFNADKQTACFMSHDMAVGTALSLAQDPDNVAKTVKSNSDADRTATDERLAKYLTARGKFQDRCLADPKIGLLPTDLSRIADILGDNGRVVSEYRHAGKPRTGEPNIKYGGFTGGELKAHGVVSFVKLAANASGNGWLKAPIADAADGAGICHVDEIPYHAQKSADDNHKWAGCDVAKCDVERHGDNANRGATYKKRSALGADGWHTVNADGTRTNVAELEWDTVATDPTP